MKLDSSTKEDWGPWMKAEAVDFKIGDIFILDLDGTLPQASNIYRIQKFNTHNRYADMDAYVSTTTGAWTLGGNGWFMTGPTKVRFYIGNSPTIAPVSKSTGIACKKCKSFNEFATANQSDGSYVCYECR